MKQKPQSLPLLPWLSGVTTLCMVAAVFVCSTSAGTADERTNTPKTDTAASDEKSTGQPLAKTAESQSLPDESSPLPSAEEILNQARARLEGLDSLRCEFHQTALIAGMKLRAFGDYVEASGNRVRLRYLILPMSSIQTDDAAALALDAPESEISKDSSRGILTQVSDGSVLYTSWKNGDTQRVSRRNIHDILEAAKQVASVDPNQIAMDLGIGGLRGLVSRLQAQMEFGPVKRIKVGDREMLEVTGRWNSRIRNEVFKLPEGTLADPRPYVPEYVRVYVDEETMLLRRIQFLKRSLDATQKAVRPMLTLDLKKLVLNDPVDDNSFVFGTPEDEAEELSENKQDDLTEQVIQMIKNSVQTSTSGSPSPVSPP